MTLETTVSYNSEMSEVASAPATLYDLVERIDKLAEDGKVRGTGRTMLKLNEIQGLITDIKHELPKVTSVSEQIVMKRDEMISEAETYMESTRQLATKEADEMRHKAREERDAILAQAKKKAMEVVEQSSVIKASKVEAERIIEHASEEAEKITVRAKREANTIVSAADEKSSRQTMETDEYSRRMLMKLEERLSHTLMQVRQGIDVVNESLEEREKQRSRAQAMRVNVEGVKTF